MGAVGALAWRGALGAGAAVTRVIAGAARGRRLAVPAGQLTRPTSDRAREGLFGTLAALHGPLDGAGLLDLYAGSGAVGLEALSRGARRVLFVEADARAARVIRGNIAAVGLAGAELVTDRVERLLSRGPAGPDRYDLAVADPPYAVTEDGGQRRCWPRWPAAGGWPLRRSSPSSGPPAPGRSAGRPGTRRTGPVATVIRRSGTVSPQAPS